jgi:hypothetical protein
MPCRSKLMGECRAVAVGYIPRYSCSYRVSRCCWKGCRLDCSMLCQLGMSEGSIHSVVRSSIRKMHIAGRLIPRCTRCCRSRWVVGSLSPGIGIRRSIGPVYIPGFCTETLSILSRMGNYTCLLKDYRLSRLYSSEFINI